MENISHSKEYSVRQATFETPTNKSLRLAFTYFCLNVMFVKYTIPMTFVIYTNKKIFYTL